MCSSCWRLTASLFAVAAAKVDPPRLLAGRGGCTVLTKSSALISFAVLTDGPASGVTPTVLTKDSPVQGR